MNNFFPMQIFFYENLEVLDNAWRPNWHQKFQSQLLYFLELLHLELLNLVGKYFIVWYILEKIKVCDVVLSKCQTDLKFTSRPLTVFCNQKHADTFTHLCSYI